jgi:hypothetical protein
MQTGAVQMLLDTDGRLDASLGHPNENKDPTSSELESEQNLPGNLK